MTLRPAGRSLGGVIPRPALSLALVLAAGVLPAAAAMDVFHQWETPDGSIYIGETPPEGSVLLRRIELPSRDVAGGVAREAEDGDAFSRAAEDGRDLIRRREASREAERDREVARAEREREIIESEPDTVVVVRWIHLPHRRRHHDHDHGPKLGIGPNPLPRVVRPDTRWVERPRLPLRSIPRALAPSRSSSRGPWARR